jgi:DNA-binding CsgD family transcriptional regulator
LYFRVTFIPANHATPDLVVGWIRLAVSLVMGYVAPLVVVQLKHGRASARSLLLLCIVPAVVLAGIIVYTITAFVPLSVALNMGFNAFQLAVAAGGIVVLRKAVPDPRAASLRAFFTLSVVFYGLTILYAALGQVVRSALVPGANTVATGTFGLAWSTLVIADQVRRTRAQSREAGSLPPFFLAEYRITPREAGIIKPLADGLTTKEIGQLLFVSHRTVETHCQNIYRKCGVSNRVELLKLIESCRAR